MRVGASVAALAASTLLIAAAALAGPQFIVSKTPDPISYNPLSSAPEIALAPSATFTLTSMRTAIYLIIEVLAFIQSDWELIPDRPRIVISAPATENPTGTVLFRLSESFPSGAIVMSDSPWLIPLDPTLFGDPLAVDFQIDRGQHPDASSPSGSVTGGVTLLYETEAGQKKGTVPIVDTIEPGATPSAISALAAGELALFAPGGETIVLFVTTTVDGTGDTVLRID